MIHRHPGTIPLALLVAGSLAACVPTLSQSRTSDPLPPGFDARTVELRSNWTGGVGYARFWMACLERQGDTHTFTGTEEMEVGGPEGYKRAGPLPITVPDSAMRALLGVLASAPRRRGVYQTIYTHTDDYPEFTMTLRSDAGVVEFFSDSQSDRNWRVTLGGERYVSESVVPFEAQEHLKPFYRSADLDRILAAAPAVREYRTAGEGAACPAAAARTPTSVP
jgi:hypothetical protein